VKTANLIFKKTTGLPFEPWHSTRMTLQFLLVMLNVLDSRVLHAFVSVHVVIIYYSPK